MKKVRILIVDDSARFAAAAADFLSASAGIDVLPPALSAEEALPRVAEERPDLVLTDLYMPGMDGLALTRAVKRIERAPRVVMVSLSDTVWHAEEARLAGADEFLAKSKISAEMFPLIERLFGAVLEPGLEGERT